MEIEEILIEELKNRLKDQFGGCISAGYIKDIECKECGEKEAYAYAKKPFRIRCNRQNSCGSDVTYTEYFPDLLKELYAREKKKSIDPSFAGKFYAHVVRGIKDFEKWGGTYENTSIGGKIYPALSFLLSDEKTKNQRLIKAPRNHHNTGDTKGLLWIPKTGIKLDEPVYVAESPIKAMALLETGRQSIACVSTSTDPDVCEWIYENVPKKLILAFDADPAGEKATRRWMKYCDTESEDGGFDKIPYEVVFPIKGDWDDMLKEGRLDDYNWEKCRVKGALFRAKNPLAAAEALKEITEFVPDIFEWRGLTCKPIWKADKETGEVHLVGANVIINGTVRSLFSIKREGVATVEEARPIENFLTLVTPEGNTTTTLAAATNIANKNSFHEFLIERSRLDFTGSAKDLSYLLHHHIKYQSQKLIRQVDRFGYDEKTKAFVFKQVAIDEKGHSHYPNKKGYFDKIAVMPPLNYSSDAVDGPFKEINVKRFMNDLWDAYGAKSWLMLGYYVATYFSHIHFKELGYHPFLSVYGPRGSGKSTLTTKMNEAFTFIKEEGTAYSKANTLKGYARVLSERISLPICLLEGNDEKRMNLSSEDLLPLYNRNASQTTAKKTMDNSTRKMPFDAGLVTVQMQEPFSSAGVKQRFISLQFPEKDNVFTEEETKAFESLITTPPSGLGVSILKERKFFETSWMNELRRNVKNLRETGVKQERVLGNYSIVLTGLMTFLMKFLPEEKDKFIECRDFLVESAKKKVIDSLSDDNSLAQGFFDAFEALCDSESNTFSTFERGKHYIEDHDTLYVRMTEVLAVMERNHYSFARDRLGIEDALRKHPRFLRKEKKMSRGLWSVGSKSFHCFWFKKKLDED